MRVKGFDSYMLTAQHPRVVSATTIVFDLKSYKESTVLLYAWHGNRNRCAMSKQK